MAAAARNRLVFARSMVIVHRSLEDVVNCRSKVIVCRILEEVEEIYRKD